MNVIRILIASILAIVLMHTSVQYGTIWDSQANPSRGVTVTFKGGTQVKGDLSTAWNGGYILQTDTSELRFNDFEMMEYQPASVEGNILARHWRTMVPMGLVLTIYALWLAFSFRRNRQ